MQSVEQLAALASRVQNDIITDVNPSSGLPVTAPLNKRVERSKFNALLDEMTDEEIKMTAFCLCFNERVQDAVKSYHKSVGHYTQIASIVFQMEKRGIKISA